MKPRKIARGLPTNVAASVGRIIARWSYQEYLINIIAYMAAGVDLKQGRIAIRSGKPEELLTMIEDLLALRGIRFRRGYFSSLGNLLRENRAKRDSLAHSLWVHTERGLAIQDTRGKAWNAQAGVRKEFNSRTTKKMKPAAIVMDRAHLGGLRKNIEIGIRSTLRLQQQCIAALEASLQTPREPDLPSPQTPAQQIENTPQPPHQSSRE